MKSPIHHNKQASALLFAIIIVALLLFLWVFLLGKIVPASRDVKGIEQGNIAYYHAESAEEQALTYMSGSNPFSTLSDSGSVGNTSSGSTYTIAKESSTIPASGNGNSPYDKDWNIIAPGTPLQLRFGNSVDWNDPNEFKIAFRIPKNAAWNGYTLSSGSGIINWNFVNGSTLTLIWSGGVIKQGNIGEYNTSFESRSFSMNEKTGINIFNNTESTIWSFYSTNLASFLNCNTTQKCSIKFSIINTLDAKNSGGDVITLPFLEYKIMWEKIPEQYATISSDGYYRWYRKESTKKVQQTTTNEALDFAVFQ